MEYQFFVIAMCFFIGFFIEGIFGVGGLVISLALASFFIDTHLGVILGIYAAIVSSSLILLRERNFLRRDVLIRVLPIVIVGGVLGTFLFGIVSEKILLTILITVLLFLSVRLMGVFRVFMMSGKWIFYPTLILGSLIQGILGTGGPLISISVSEQITSRYEIRATLASIFLVSVFLRSIQLFSTGRFQVHNLEEYWWIGGVVILGVFCGSPLLQRFSDEKARKILGATLFVIGMLLITRI